MNGRERVEENFSPVERVEERKGGREPVEDQAVRGGVEIVNAMRT